MQAAESQSLSVAADRLIHVARLRFERFGYRRTGIAEIARDAGVAAGTVYRYFPGKEELFLAVLEADHAEWLARARQALAPTGTAVERFARLALASVEYNEQSALLRAVRRRDTDIVFAPVLDEIHERWTRSNVELMAEVVRDGVAEGSLRPVDPERMAFLLYIAGEALFHQDMYSYAELSPLWGDLVWNGIAATRDIAPAGSDLATKVLAGSNAKPRAKRRTARTHGVREGEPR